MAALKWIRKKDGWGLPFYTAHAPNGTTYFIERNCRRRTPGYFVKVNSKLAKPIAEEILLVDAKKAAEQHLAP